MSPGPTGAPLKSLLLGRSVTMATTVMAGVYGSRCPGNPEALACPTSSCVCEWGGGECECACVPGSPSEGAAELLLKNVLVCESLIDFSVHFVVLVSCKDSYGCCHCCCWEPQPRFNIKTVFACMGIPRMGVPIPENTVILKPCPGYQQRWYPHVPLTCDLDGLSADCSVTFLRPLTLCDKFPVSRGPVIWTPFY